MSLQRAALTASFLTLASLTLRSDSVGAGPTAVPAPAGLVENLFAPTVLNKIAAPNPAPAGMVWVPGGEFSMGATPSSEGLCQMGSITRDSLPIHRVYVDGFWMDQTEVTNSQFAT